MKLEEAQRTAVIDALLAIGMFVLSIGSVVVWATDTDPNVKHLDTWGYLLLAGQTLPLIWRRRFPVWVLSVIVIAFMFDRAANYPGSWAFFGISFAVYTVGTQLPPKRSLLVGGIALDVVLLWTAVGIFMLDVEPFALISEIAVIGFPLLIGRETYHRQQRMIELERRALTAEHERERQAALAVAEERIRIARELHDVVAHEITVMTIQSSGARRILSKDPDRAEAAIKSAEAAGHRALTEIRRLLGMLRTSDPKTVDPQPGIASLDALVAQMNQAGVLTTLTINGDARELPLGIDLNVYRIIQESLTNTLKHGGPDVHAEIVVSYDNSTLTVEVLDDGRGAAAVHAPSDLSGQGLVGMQERAALLDGALQTGPRPGGGFRVSAKIPIPVA